MQITTFAVGLAKTKFQVHGYTTLGEKALAKTLTRAKPGRVGTLCVPTRWSSPGGNAWVVDI